ncbi:MAG: GIY-YIG nuclease family protein [Cyanobacteria bacterium P01_F01_bin.42]
MLTITPLANIPADPFINSDGKLPENFANKIGAYAVFNQDNRLVHLGFSRNVQLSLKQSLVRRPESCQWVKVETIDRPSKSHLQDILTQWQTECGGDPYSIDNPERRWTESINLHEHLTADEQARYADPETNDRGKIKILKQASRRIESDILTKLRDRGFDDSLRFNPKLKESGVLEIKD